MPIYSDVVASRLEKYRSQLERDSTNDADIDGAIFRFVFCQLVDAAFGGGGGGGGGSTSAATIASGINQSIDIDTIIARLTDIDTNQLNQTAVRAAIDSSVDLDTIIARLQSIDTKALDGSAISAAIDGASTMALITNAILSIEAGQLGAADVAAAIQSAADIDAIVAQLSAIAATVYPVGARTIAQSQSVSIASDQTINVRDRSTTVPIAQTTIALAAGGTDQFVIPANARSLTICITSGSLVHFTEDGSVPTTNSCWFGGGTKEIWDYAVPASATLRFLAVSAATISIQVRV